MPPYVIFHDSTLREMAELKPVTLQALSRVSGVGDAKLERYGAAFVEVIDAHLATVQGAGMNFRELDRQVLVADSAMQPPRHGRRGGAKA